MARTAVKESVHLSRFGVLVAQLESIVAAASHKSPDPLLCFDLLSDLIAAVEEEPKESVLLPQRKCEDALYSLLVLGACRPVRHLASVAMAKIILKGDPISIYSRASSLQGFLSEGKKNEAQKVAGAAQCLGELYHYFGRRIHSGLLETINIVAKLIKFNEDFVRQEALDMLRNALEGFEGNAVSAAYVDAFRVIIRTGVFDKSSSVRLAAARCLKVFANVGGPGLGAGDLENCLSFCLKALEESEKSVRDAFTEALGALLALGMNPEAQVQPRGKVPATSKKFEGGLLKYLSAPFTKVGGPHLKEIRVGVALSWVSFLQTMSLKYHLLDSELQTYALQVMDMLRADTFIDAQALACVLYIIRVGIIDQLSEPSQRSFLIFLTKQLQSTDSTPSIRVAVLRTLSCVLKTLGEVPLEFKEVIDDTIVAAVSHHIPLVRVEAALTLRVLAEVDPSCVGGLISYAVTMLNAARESVSFGKGSNFHRELESLNGQAAVLASLVSISHKLPLGYPARLPMSIVEACRSLLMESSRNPVAASVEKEAGWNLLSSLLTSMPKEEFHDQIFDILAFWASTFKGSPEQDINRAHDLAAEICVWSAAVDALTSYMKCFVSSDSQNGKILLQPVLLYLSRALSYVSHLSGKEQAGAKSSSSLFIIRVLLAYEALSDPYLYASDHARLIQICTTPFREASKYEESSCLMIFLNKRDAWLGPWIPGRDLFEDELLYFQGGKDGSLTCVWESEPASFPQPETISKMLVNQMLLFFGTIFACQDSNGMLSLIGIMDDCLKAGKRQPWHAASMTNICVGLLAGLKSILAQRPEPLELKILVAAQAIFQSILAEGDICASQRRASAEGLGLLARLGNDIYTARLTKQFLVDVTGNIDLYYAGSVALAVGCIHQSAGGMALSSLVPSTVNAISLLAKGSVHTLQLWSLHGLLLTIEAAGLSYVSHVQSTLGLILEIILSEESSLLELQQAVARLINALVAVVGPELSPASTFFSRCKVAIAEISSCQETAALLESVRFTQQLVLFAPQAISVHSHVQTLLSTLSSRQPTLRHIALATLRHLIEKDPVPIIAEQIEGTLFHMLDEETDADIGNLACATIKRLLFASCPLCPSHWLIICRSMILSTSSNFKIESKDMLNGSSTVRDGDKKLSFGDDDENMVSDSKRRPILTSQDKHLRYRTRVFAAECLSQLPFAVGENPAHFDHLLAKSQTMMGSSSPDWLVFHLQEIISLAYQISTIQFEKMRPVGVSLLCTIVDKFATSADPELPDHLLLEQYQAQLISAVRSALDSFSDPILLEAGLQLATKMLTSGILSRDHAAVKRIFSLISRPLEDFDGLFYPSCAEWVSCKIKVRLLMVHASLKSYMSGFTKGQSDESSDQYPASLPLFAKSSSILGKYWLSFLKDLCCVCFNLHLENRKPFIEGIQTATNSVELKACLEEAWPVILQALVLDAVPSNSSSNVSPSSDGSENIPDSGYRMYEIQLDDFKFIWGFLLLIIYQEQDVTTSKQIIPLSHLRLNLSNDFTTDDSYSISSKLSNLLLPVFKFVSSERIFKCGFLTSDACKELLEVFLCLIFSKDTWDYLAIFFLSQVIRNCPNDFLESRSFACLVAELCFSFLSKILSSSRASDWEKTISVALTATSTLLNRFEAQMQIKLLVPSLLVGYRCIGETTNETALSRVNDFIQSVASLLKRLVSTDLGSDGIIHLISVIAAVFDATSSLANDCIYEIHQVDKKSNSHKLLLLKLGIAVEQLSLCSYLAFTFEGPRKSQEKSPVLSRVLHLSIQCVQDFLSDTNGQSQLVALQVIKAMLQKGFGRESNSFLVFYVWELVEVIFLIVQRFSEGPSEREAILISGECLKILMLLLAFTSGSDCQKSLTRLLLEAIFIILQVSDQEANDLQELAVKLVSQLAQTPSSAACIKDILLEMPAMQRQRLQDMIRTSVNQENNPRPMLSSTPPLVIKLPSETKQTEERNILPPADPPRGSTDSVVEEDEDEDEDEDDWNTFQSFPVTRNDSLAAAPEESSFSDHGSIESKSSHDKGNPSFEDIEVGAAASVCLTQDIGDTTEIHEESMDDHISGEDVHNIADDCYDVSSNQVDNIQESHSENHILGNNSRETEVENHGKTSPASQHGNGEESFASPSKHHHQVSHGNLQLSSEEHVAVDGVRLEKLTQNLNTENDNRSETKDSGN